MRLAPVFATAATAAFLALGCASTALASTGAAHEATAELAEQGRMLGQRATKAYLMTLQGVSPDAGRSILADSVSRFERNLAALRAGKLDDSARAKLAAVDSTWIEVRALLTAAPSASGAKALYDSTAALDQASQHLVMAINDRGPEESRRLILASRMRMLSQRIAMHYLYRASGLMTPNAPQMELTYARSEFAANLSRSTQNNAFPAETREAVAKLAGIWPAYQGAAGKTGEPVAMLRNAPAVMEMSEQVLGATDKVVGSLLAPAR
ncbi:type IV pili methyl-accepting chemotaxis transducer N-terminal domain-containing protein [Zoogloea sp.]|uniref:type IV pili methyl-accepting chemotaxis transducer N-terminal domain-containing protein n=1 Tax=Zoogloea sp. TaxID=49181 RepID=UPI002612F279|nr:type IV pili methyl-accepting chemotaxis transducer N-terminal domain-containing protein [Zoogloea sp.]